LTASDCLLGIAVSPGSDQAVVGGGTDSLIQTANRPKRNRTLAPPRELPETLRSLSTAEGGAMVAAAHSMPASRPGRLESGGTS
jgi:hypothetical protein